MSWRGLVVAVLLAALGVAAGAGIALSQREEPTALDQTVPAAASDPSIPTNPAVVIKPDPLTAALATDVPSQVAKVGQKPFGLELPVPVGWTRSNPKAGEWRWFVEGHPSNTYVLRVVLPSGYSTISDARDDRIAALDGATGIQEFTLEATGSDGFTATYVLDGYKRLTMERFISIDDSQTVYATVAMIGREVDRAGMADLLDTIAANAEKWD